MNVQARADRRPAQRHKRARLARWSPWGSSVRARAAAMFEVQMWLWGRDLTRPSGNLLVERGLTREPAPGPSQGVTRYRLERPDGGLALWGWGAFFGVDGLGGLYVSRPGFELRWRIEATTPRDVWQAERMTGFGALTSPEGRRSASTLLARSFRWIADYERFAAEASVEDRRATVAARDTWPAAVARIAHSLAASPVPDATAVAWDELLTALPTGEDL